MLKFLLVGLLVFGSGESGDGPPGGLAPASRRAGSGFPGTQPQISTEPTLNRIGELLDEGDLIDAYLLRERLRVDSQATDEAVRELRQSIEEQFQEESREQELQIAPEYVWVHKPRIDKKWREAVAMARQRTTYVKSGITVMRLRFEDPSREGRIGVFAQRLEIYHTWDGGHGGYVALRSGEFLILGGRWSNGESSIEIQSLGHACPRLRIDVPAEGITGGGEVLVRAIARDRLGSLRVKIEPEPGVSRSGAFVRIGRRYADYRGGYPVSADGTCTIRNLAAGPCDLYVTAGELSCCPHRKAVIDAGKVTELTLPLYARRRVGIECKYRTTGDEEWREVTSDALTGRPTSFDIPELIGSLCDLSDWDGEGASIQKMNADLMPAAPGDFEVPSVPSREKLRASGYGPHPLRVNSVFALRYLDREARDCEAVIHVRSIEPVSAPASSDH